jgi:hypothetical protein
VHSTEPEAGDPDWLVDPRFATDDARGEHGALISARMQRWCASRPRRRRAHPRRRDDPPHRTRGFEMSTDAFFKSPGCRRAASEPAGYALVLCVDE